MPRRVVATQSDLHPLVRASLEEAHLGGMGVPFVSPELLNVLQEQSASDDVRVRRQSLCYRMMQHDGLELGLDAEDWPALSDEAAVDNPDERIDPLAELMITSMLSDGWLRRGYFHRGAAALAESLVWAEALGVPEIHSSLTASLGTALTLGGYVSEGLSVITRSSSAVLDTSTYRFFGTGGRLGMERRQVMELSDASEHSRNYGRATIGYQLVTSLIGPSEIRARINTLFALARCLCHTGRVEIAAEVYRDAAADREALTRVAVVGVLSQMKAERTRAVMQAYLGDVDGALQRCATVLTPELHDHMVGVYMETLVDATSIARRADDPKWIIAQVGDVDLHNEEGVGLLATYVYEDLAWAYRRLSDRPNAARYAEMAQLGRQRFGARSGHSPFGSESSPGVLRSARELHDRALRARDREQMSLARGIGSVTHDVRHQLQSLEFLTGIDQPTDSSVSMVRSIVTVIDEILSALLRDVEADREIALTEVCLTTVAQDVADRFRSTADRKQIRLRCALDQPVWCRSDRVALDRIVSNLVSNAIKYSPVGGSVEVAVTTVGDSVIDLHIIDSGPGIPPAELDDLFRWGGTLSSEPTAGETQHGIGLFTAQRLAQLIGASIRAHPRRQDVPSTMSVRLPRG